MRWGEWIFFFLNFDSTFSSNPPDLKTFFYFRSQAPLENFILSSFLQIKWNRIWDLNVQWNWRIDGSRRLLEAEGKKAPVNSSIRLIFYEHIMVVTSPKTNEILGFWSIFIRGWESFTINSDKSFKNMKKSNVKSSI